MLLVMTERSVKQRCECLALFFLKSVLFFKKTLVGDAPLCGPKFLYFHAVSGKKLSNSRWVPPPPRQESTGSATGRISKRVFV